jgi:hypothetical protein
MTKRISMFAIMACLASSLAFTQSKSTSSSSAEEAKTKDAQSAFHDKAQQDSDSSRQTTQAKNNKKDKKKDKRNAKPVPSDQEREFDRVLMGIYG